MQTKDYNYAKSIWKSANQLTREQYKSINYLLIISYLCKIFWPQNYIIAWDMVANWLEGSTWNADSMGSSLLTRDSNC